MAAGSESAEMRGWRGACVVRGMWTRFSRLFVIKTKFEAFIVIYGLGTGAVERGIHYLDHYPGWGGKLLFAASPLAVFMAGGRILDSVERSAAG